MSKRGTAYLLGNRPQPTTDVLKCLKTHKNGNFRDFDNCYVIKKSSIEIINYPGLFVMKKHNFSDFVQLLNLH